MKKKRINRNSVAIYQAKNGAIEVSVATQGETIFLTQQQVADIFDVQKAAVSKHVKNIFDSGELSEKATVSKRETVQQEGKRTVRRVIEYYNLDLVISIGYRVNSKKATAFRQWATKTLRNYIIDGYAIDRKRVAANYEKFIESVEDIKRLLPADAFVSSADVLELVAAFADTWLSLDAYDKDALVSGGGTKKAVALTAEQLVKALAVFKGELVRKNEATDIFGQERRAGSVAGIVGNVMQSFGGTPVYPTVEERAAHLLYFTVKDHPFVDGNKRSGAYSFVWFLRKAGILDTRKITPQTLTALTILVAESDPHHKDKMIRLVLRLLK